MPITRLSLMTGLLCLISLTGCQEKNASPTPSNTETASDAAEASAMVNSSVNDLDQFNHPASEATTTPSAQENQPASPSNDTEAATDTQPQAESVPEQFDIRVYRAESQGTMSGYIDKIDITSLNDPATTITGIKINRGNCALVRLYDAKNMRYGSVALAYPRCKAESIREISISTVNGTFTYQIR
ncbi:hypothetical protein [Acinetobacter brisouii]|uniref:hypothetical protein n=1 Tax=Acinetobacter brisouii TaxID=396323 RepID=UPI001250B536|nr:hypothetical protein [Acinetobacter brisouii]